MGMEMEMEMETKSIGETGEMMMGMRSTCWLGDRRVVVGIVHVRQ